MLRAALLAYYRINTRHPLYAVLDLLGLSLGIAVFVILGLYIRFETGYEHWLPGADQLYEVQTRYTMPGQPQRSLEVTTAALLDGLRDDYPDLEGVRILERDVAVHKGDGVIREKEELVDPGFLALFPLPLMAGDRKVALSEPGNVVLSQAMARKYLPAGGWLGATIRLGDDQGSDLYRVSGILADLPRDSDFKFDIVRPLGPAMMAAHPDWRNWGRMPLKTYLRFGFTEQARRQNDLFDGFSDRHLGNQDNGQPMHGLLSWRLAPLRSLHLADPRSRGALATLGAVGLLALLVAAINHVHLATALAGLRAREVAVRRSVGATRRVLVGQFLIEALLTALITWTAGLALAELSLPVINAATGLSLAIPYRGDIGFLAALMAMVVLAVLLSGIYPALLLSRFQPAQVMAASRASSGGRVGRWMRQALVAGQFSVVVVLFVLTWGFFSQIEHLHRADLGFRRGGLLLTASTRDPAVTPDLQRQLVAALRGVPGVTSLGLGQNAPGDEDGGSSHVVVTIAGQAREISMLRSEIDADFFTTYGAALLAGRFLSADRPEDGEPAAGAAQHVVLNAKAASLLGFPTAEDAVNKTFDSYGKRFEIVGIVGNLRFRSPKNEIPGIYYYRRGEKSLVRDVAAIRFQGASEPEMRDRLAAAWRRVAPDIPLELASADDNLDHYYRADRDRSRLFAIGAVGAAVIGCLGLYGIAVFSTSRRMLEVAVRKVLGASRGALVKLLLGQFMQPVLLANLLAWPVAYIVLADWLAQFNDRIAIGILPFLCSAGAALALALATVAAHAVNAANAAPGKALRSE